jgi:hypothetical protein
MLEELVISKFHDNRKKAKIKEKVITTTGYFQNKLIVITVHPISLLQEINAFLILKYSRDIFSVDII